MKFKNILHTIGNTPIVKLDKIFQTASKKNISIWIKMEKTNPGSSIKDRIALAMIEDAEKSGELNKSMEIIEPTSGNTGIGLAMIAAVKGYKITLVMPESMSIERRKVMKAYGANILLTPKEQGMNGAIAKAKSISNETNSWMPSQFTNASNPMVHRNTTAQEILEDFPEGIDYFIAGVGTGGHISGCGEVLKKEFPNIKIIGVEPSKSSVLSGNKPGPHKIQGIGAGFIPKTLNENIIDEIIQVDDTQAFEFTRKLAEQEGILAGVSTGSSIAALSQIIEKIPESSQVLLINYDSGEKYLSTEDLF